MGKRDTKKLNNTNGKESITPTVVYDEFFDFGSWRMQPYTEGYVLERAQQLVKWATEDESALKVSSYLHKIGINWDTHLKWCEKYPQWKASYNKARHIIGDRREIGGLVGKYNGMLVEKTMPMYDPEYANETERRAALTKQDNDEAKVFNLILPAAPVSELVPQKQSANAPLPFRDSDDKQAKREMS